MQLSTAFLASTALLNAARAAPAPQSYSLITIHSGDASVHLQPIGFSKSGAVSIDAENPMTVFFDDGKLGVTGAHGEHGAQDYWNAEGDNSIIINDIGTAGFSLEGDDIAYNGAQSFGVCADNGKLYVQEPPSCYNFIGVAVHVSPAH